MPRGGLDILIDLVLPVSLVTCMYIEMYNLYPMHYGHSNPILKQSCWVSSRQNVDRWNVIKQKCPRGSSLEGEDEIDAGAKKSAVVMQKEPARLLRPSPPL